MPVSPALILASASQRRQQFLRDLEVPFSIQVAAIDESPLPGEEAAAMTQRLAEAKAWAAAGLVEERSPHALIVASDTTVALDGVLYGKPAEAAEAAQMLRALRGRDHAVISAVTVLRLPDRRLATRVNQSIVTMRAYTDRELDAYVQSGDPLDKAGAYGIQSATFAPVCALQGCYAGVMGLPLADLCALLAQFGMPIPKPAVDVCRPINPFGCCACRDAAARPQEPPPGRDDFEQLPCTW